MSQAYWGPQIKFGIPQPALSVNMDTWSNVESLHFTYEPRQVGAAGRLHPGPASRKVVLPMPIPPVTPLNPPLGVFVPPPQKIEFMQDNAKLGPAQAMLMRHGAGVEQRRRGQRQRLAGRACATAAS